MEIKERNGLEKERERTRHEDAGRLGPKRQQWPVRSSQWQEGLLNAVVSIVCGTPRQREQPPGSYSYSNMFSAGDNKGGLGEDEFPLIHTKKSSFGLAGRPWKMLKIAVLFHVAASNVAHPAHCSWLSSPNSHLNYIILNFPLWRGSF